MKKHSYEFINMVISEYKKDKSANKIIERYEISKSTLYYWLKTNKIIILIDSFLQLMHLIFLLMHHL